MIAANHPSLGAAIDQQRHAPIIFRVVNPKVPAPGPNPPNQITPPFTPPVQGEPEPPAPVYGEPIQGEPVEIVTSQTPAIAPASASVATPATDASSSFSFMDWLTAETIVPGYPNGLIGAGGVIALAWIFGGKKGRRR